MVQFIALLDAQERWKSYLQIGYLRGVQSHSCWEMGQSRVIVNYVQNALDYVRESVCVLRGAEKDVVEEIQREMRRRIGNKSSFRQLSQSATF